METYEKNEFEVLRTIPGRRVEAVQFGCKWLAAASEWPELLAEGLTAQGAIADLQRQIERASGGTEVMTNGKENHC